MHRAPAVSFSVAKSRWHLYLIVSLALLAALVAGAFVSTQPRSDIGIWLPVGVLLLTVAIALAAWHRSPAGLLHWDGRSWHWSGFSATQGCHLSLVMDFQKVLLVSLKEAGGQPVWLWLQADSRDPLWLSLRRAVVSSRTISGGEQEVEPHEPDGYAA